MFLELCNIINIIINKILDSRPPAVSMSHTGPLYCVFMPEVDRL